MEPPPKEGKNEVALKITEAAIAAIPVVGGPLAVLSEFLAVPYSRRQKTWLERLAEVVSELQDRVSELSKPLDENERFLTAVLHANQIAMRTHQEEKLAALRNAVRNSALRSAPDDDQQLMFLRFIDDFTALHIRVLEVLDDPAAAAKATGKAMNFTGGLPLMLYHCIPELNGQGFFCEQICGDLENRGLIQQGTKVNVMMTPQQMITPRTMGPGKEFLTFIGK